MNLAQQITEKLGGEWHCRYGLAPGPGHSKNDRSLRIALHKSDLDDVVLHSYCGDDVVALKKAWRNEGLLPRRGQGDYVIDPAKIAKAKLDKLKREADEATEAEKRQSRACWLYSLSRPGAGTVVETYLAGRGIEIKPLPETIRFLPASAKHLHPAMVAAFGLPDEAMPGTYHLPPERITGLHITYLRPDGSGKAEIDPQKRMLGAVKGSPLALVPPRDGLGLHIGEGIETVLIGHYATGLGAWAAGSATFLPALADAVPPWIETVTIAREPDPAGRRGAEELARRLEARAIETIMLGA